MSDPTVKVVAVLETMWDWRNQTSSAGYKAEAPRFFKINPRNHSGKRLYDLVGPDHELLVTNACKELVVSANHHGKPDPVWLRENLTMLVNDHGVKLLLVCGNVAFKTLVKSGYMPPEGVRMLNLPRPAARNWSRHKIAMWKAVIQRELSEVCK